MINFRIQDLQQYLNSYTQNRFVMTSTEFQDTCFIRFRTHQYLNVFKIFIETSYDRTVRKRS